MESISDFAEKLKQSQLATDPAAASVPKFNIKDLFTTKDTTPDMTSQVITALMPAIGALGGYALGGYSGGAAGAQGGLSGVTAMENFKKMQQEKAQKEQERKLKSYDVMTDLYSKGLKVTDNGDIASDPESQYWKDKEAQRIEKAKFNAMLLQGKDRELALKEIAQEEKAKADKEKLKIDLTHKGFVLNPETGEYEFNKKAYEDIKKAGKVGGTGVSKDAAVLRKEFNGRPEVKNYKDIQIQASKIEKAATNPSAAGDLSLIFSYMKLLDPGSTVREGEFANAQNAAGVPDKILNMYNKAKTGERLNPTQRSDFINQSRSLVQSHKDAYDTARTEFEGYAQLYGVNPNLVVASLQSQSAPSKSAPTTAKQGQTTTQTPGITREEKLKRLKALEGK